MFFDGPTNLGDFVSQSLFSCFFVNLIVFALGLLIGQAAVRKALYMAALTARRCNPVIKEFSRRLEAIGKPFKVVLTACMRKLLVILNTIVKNNSVWSTKFNIST